LWWTVFLNVEAKYILNDIDENIYNLHIFCNKANEKNFINEVLNYIKYNLSRSFLEDVVPKELKQEYKKHTMPNTINKVMIN